jgi:hypothetical protein
MVRGERFPAGLFHGYQGTAESPSNAARTGARSPPILVAEAPTSTCRSTTRCIIRRSVRCSTMTRLKGIRIEQAINASSAGPARGERLVEASEELRSISRTLKAPTARLLYAHPQHGHLGRQLRERLAHRGSHGFFIALDSTITLRMRKRERRDVMLNDLYKGYKQLDKSPDEIVTPCVSPCPRRTRASTSRK